MQDMTKAFSSLEPYVGGFKSQVFSNLAIQLVLAIPITFFVVVNHYGYDSILPTTADFTRLFSENGQDWHWRRRLMSDADFRIVQYFMIAILVCFSALFSGLTLGLLGLDKIGLQIVMSGDNGHLAEKAAKIAPIRDNGNLLLCTLLLGNVAVNASLSILMADLTSGLFGFIFSTITIVIFGEIIPQAACSRYALDIGAFCVPIVQVLIYLLYVFTKPLSIVLDIWLGDEIGTIHTRQELSELLRIHVDHGAMDEETGNVAQGAIKYQNMLVKDVMTDIGKCYMLSASDNLNFKKITEIFRSGFSRIPVYEKNKDDIIGLLLVKDLIFVDPEDETPIRNFIQIFGRSFLLCWPDQKLGDTLRLFKKGGSHMAIVRDVKDDESGGDPYYVISGVITLEDILEEIIGDEIVDETDVAVNNIDEISNGPSTFDYDRLRLLDSGKLEYEKITSKEAAAIGSHLIKNVPQLHRDCNGNTLQLTDNDVACLLDQCPVYDLTRSGDGYSEIHDSDLLFRKGESCDYMILVLTGKLIVLAGRDRFRSEAGPWTILGADALVMPEDSSYTPDFSAYIATETLRCVRISREEFQKAKSGEKVFGKEGDGSRKARGSFFKGKGLKAKIDMMSPLPSSEKSRLVTDEDREMLPGPLPGTSKTGEENQRGSTEGIELSGLDQKKPSSISGIGEKYKSSYEQLPTSPVDGYGGSS